MPITCPACGEENPDQALCCATCKEPFRQVAPGRPPFSGAPPSPRAQDAQRLKTEADAHARAGRTAEALAGYLRATDLDPELAEGWLFRGQLEKSLGKEGAARESLRRAVSLGPGRLPREAVAAARRDLYLLENPGRTLDPRRAEALLEEGHALLTQGQAAAALGPLEQALACDPTSWQAWFNRGAALFVTNRFEEALACYHRTLELEDAVAVQALHGKSLCLIQLKRWPEALAALTTAAQRDPRNPEIAEMHAKVAFLIQAEELEALAR
jgi:tetratricopeptide (TPR) repeat protein